MTRMYCIGDIQGCAETLDEWLAAVGFSPSRHTLYVLGDMVNRGPDSAGVLRRLMALQQQGSAHCLLGNHDIHLLAVAQGLRRMGHKDTLTSLLCAEDATVLLGWLRQQPLALHANSCLMVHAGVQPDWDVEQTLACAEEASAQLRGAHWTTFLGEVFGNTPARWSNQLQDMARWRVIINTLTRMRFLQPDGSMDFTQKRGLDEAPPTLLPWFTHPLRRTADTLVAFGHWSALGLIRRHNLLALDTGCVWGGMLSGAGINADGSLGEIVQVPNRNGVEP